MNRFKELAGRLREKAVDAFPTATTSRISSKDDLIALMVANFELTLSALDLAASVEGSGDDLVKRLRAPAYWISGSKDEHEGENDAPFLAASRLAAQEVEIKALKHDLDRCITREHEALNATLTKDKL